MILTPWELVRKNKVEIVQSLREEGYILLALGNRGRKGGYNRPFATVIPYPPSTRPFEIDGEKWVMYRLAPPFK